MTRSSRPAEIDNLPGPFRREVEKFLKEHPLTPAGRLRPYFLQRGETWLAFVGPSEKEGKSGFGPTPLTALHAFNRNFGRADGNGAAE